MVQGGNDVLCLLALRNCLMLRQRRPGLDFNNVYP